MSDVTPSPLAKAGVVVSALGLVATVAMVAPDHPILVVPLLAGLAALVPAWRGTGDRPHAAWALVALLPLMAAGAGIGVYMTQHHEIGLYGSEEDQAVELVGCAESEGVSCDIVNTSEWSEVLGVPLFTWAVPFYALLAILAVLALTGRHRQKSLLLVAGVGSVLFSGFLYYISKVELGYVCLWCMRLYALNALIPALATASGLSRDDLPTAGTLGIALGAFVTLAGLSVAVQKSYRAQLLEGTPQIAELAEPVEVPAEEAPSDPVGDAPALSFPITTEDGNEATIDVQPDDAWKGNPDAKVAIVEFADFECGYCKRAGFQLRRLYEHYKDEIVFVYKHFPMDPTCNPGVNNKRHRYACQAHEASVCAQMQGKFWAFHDLLYKNNHQLRAEHLIAYADKVGMDTDRFVSCMRNGEGKAKVQSSGLEGKLADIHGTPRIFIDGRLYRSGASAEQMARSIELALGRSGAEALEAAAEMREDTPQVAPIPDDVPEMQRVTYGDLDFYIDTFESALVDGRAKSGDHEIPATQMSWFAAADACEAAGKRMCSEEEWIAACQSEAPVDDDDDGQFADDLIEGNAYPYGDFHTRNLCWEDHAINRRLPADQQPSWRPVYTGEMPGCVTEDGVYDMAGNVEEWVGSSADVAVLLGGAYDTPDDKARCYRRNDTYGAGYANRRTGFRCCRNAP